MSDYKFYLNLTEEESIKFANKAIRETSDIQQLEETLLYLALFTNGNCLKPLYSELVKKQIFYPAEIYIHADKLIADELIKLIEEGSASVNHLLCCLAWIGTPNVIDLFINSSVKKPDWTEELYVLPKEYSYQAGWFIDGDLRKEYLINPKVTVFSKHTSSIEKDYQAKTFIEKKSVCKFCENNLTTVFESEIDSFKIPFTTCLLCSAYEPFFMKIDDKGNEHWHPANKKWSHFDEFDLTIEKIKENTLAVSDEIRKPEFTISQFVTISKSQVGGYPTWIQDADYLNCPDCNQKMQYLGQIDMEDVEEFGEGIYYFHFCKNCKVTGNNYQQT